MFWRNNTKPNMQTRNSPEWAVSSEQVIMWRSPNTEFFPSGSIKTKNTQQAFMEWESLDQRSKKQQNVFLFFLQMFQRCQTSVCPQTVETTDGEIKGTVCQISGDSVASISENCRLQPDEIKKQQISWFKTVKTLNKDISCLKKSVYFWCCSLWKGYLLRWLMQKCKGP